MANETYERGKSVGFSYGRRYAFTKVCRNLQKRGFTSKEIAEMIDISESAVRFFLTEKEDKKDSEN